MASKSKRTPRAPLPEHLEEARTHVTCGVDHPENAQATDAYGTYGADDEATAPLTAEGFRAGLHVAHVSGNLTDEVVFDIAGVPTALANAARRILLAEVPTMCIETVYIDNNTSVIPDEILAHRLGLVPIHADPGRFAWRPSGDAVATEVSDIDTLVFALKVRCVEETDPVTNEKRRLHTSVYSRDLVWVPQGDQEVEFAADPPRPVHDDILLAKLRPGQEIDLQCYVHKGIGKDHAKFSPVATAAYRLLPKVVLTRRIEGDEAHALAELCPMDVFAVVGSGAGTSGVADKEAHAEVVNARACTVCRNCLREEFGFSDAIKILRVRNHFVCLSFSLYPCSLSCFSHFGICSHC